MSAASIGRDLENRTVERFRALGCVAARCSKPSRFGATDLFGVVDIVVIELDGTITLVQVTTKNNASSHRRKIREARLRCPVLLVLWSKHGGRWVMQSEVISGNAQTEGSKRTGTDCCSA